MAWEDSEQECQEAIEREFKREQTRRSRQGLMPLQPEDFCAGFPGDQFAD